METTTSKRDIANRTTYRRRFVAGMAEIRRVGESVALTRRLAYQCPICGVIHPGVRYAHPDHREFCSQECFRARET